MHIMLNSVWAIEPIPLISTKLCSSTDGSTGGKGVGVFRVQWVNSHLICCPLFGQAEHLSDQFLSC